MFRIYLAVCSILIFTSGCLSQVFEKKNENIYGQINLNLIRITWPEPVLKKVRFANFGFRSGKVGLFPTLILISSYHSITTYIYPQTDDLAFQAKGPYAELLRNVYTKSVEWHSLIENKFFEVHSNLSRVIIEVNAKSVAYLIKGVEKLETLRGQVKSFINSRRKDNIDCVSRVDMKVEKVLYKIGNKISDCAVLADQHIQGITSKKIDLGSDILEIAELSLSETLDVVTEHFSSGRSFDELKDITQEYEEAFDEVDDEIYNEIIPAINEEMNEIRDAALAIPSTIEMCINNVLMKLNNVVGETGKMVDKCNAAWKYCCLK